MSSLGRGIAIGMTCPVLDGKGLGAGKDELKRLQLPSRFTLPVLAGRIIPMPAPGAKLLLFTIASRAVDEFAPNTESILYLVLEGMGAIGATEIDRVNSWFSSSSSSCCCF